MELSENCVSLVYSLTYEGVSKIFRTDAVKIINLTTKRLSKLPTSTQLRATWHTDLLDMVVLPSTGASRYHNCCVGGDTSPEYFGYTLVLTPWSRLLLEKLTGDAKYLLLTLVYAWHIVTNGMHQTST
jgi:hypothetical protein